MLKYDGRHHVISVLLNEKEIEIEYMKNLPFLSLF